MGSPKQKTAAKASTTTRTATRKKADEGASVEKRAARDVSVGPSTRRIAESLSKGTRQTLDFFRSTINWS
jgi:hypothetical protein